MLITNLLLLNYYLVTQWDEVKFFIIHYYTLIIQVAEKH